MLLLDVCAVVCREDASEKWQEVEVREEADIGGRRTACRQCACASSVRFANCICVLNTKGPVRASKWAFLLTVKRDTQKDKERTTKSAPNNQ